MKLNMYPWRPARGKFGEEGSEVTKPMTVTEPEANTISAESRCRWMRQPVAQRGSSVKDPRPL